MARQMANINNDTVINVKQLIILSNLWEVFVIADENADENSDQMFTLTVGDFTELGYQSKEELKPYILTTTTDLQEVLPAPNWKWLD